MRSVGVSVWASFDSIRAEASRAACMAVRAEAARLKSIAAPTKLSSGKAASASIGAALPSRFPRNREKRRRSDIHQPPGLVAARFAPVAGLLQVYSMTLRVLVAIIACGRCNCLGGKHRNFGK